MMSLNRSLPDEDEEEQETTDHRMKSFLFGLVGILLIICSIGLLHWLGYQDGWNDRDKGVGVIDTTYRSTMVLTGEGAK